MFPNPPSQLEILVKHRAKAQRYAIQSYIARLCQVPILPHRTEITPQDFLRIHQLELDSAGKSLRVFYTQHEREEREVV